MASSRILLAAGNLTAEPSFFPAKARVAIGWVDSPTRCADRPASSFIRTKARAALRRRAAVAMLCAVAILASSLPWIGSAHAERPPFVAQPAGLGAAGLIAASIMEASKRFAISERWIRAVMRVESAGNLRARSPKGAVGLMQVMPNTWAELRARYGLGADPYDPHDNILAGTAYLRELHDRYGTPGFLAAYNAGPRRYEHHLTTGRPLPDQTQAYVTTLIPMIGIKSGDAKSAVITTSITAAHPLLFIKRLANNSTIDPQAPGARPHGSPGVRAVVDLSALVPQSGNLFVRHASGERPQ